LTWLGFDWGDHLYHASDYFEQLYAWAEYLIGNGKAYVDDQPQDEMRANRGTLTEPGKNSPFRGRSVAENLDLFRRMRAGEYPNGARVLRAKIDMASGNINLRDPVLYRVALGTAGDSVIIEIKDDGRGISYEGIVERARKLGQPIPALIDEQTILQMIENHVKATSLQRVVYRHVERGESRPDCLIAQLLDRNALPERHSIPNLTGRRLRFRVIPRRIFVPLAIDHHVVIAGRPLPRTYRLRRTRLKKFLANRVPRKILVPFHLDALIALRQHDVFPSCFSHRPG
jgi:hypothetical protein